MESNTYIIDIEANGLHATKVWCLGYAKFNPYTPPVIKVTTEYDFIKKFFSDPTRTIVAHNGVMYDVPTLERVLGFKIKCKIIDTLPISWYLYSSRQKHGLESYGVDFGFPKVVVPDTAWADEKNMPLFIERVSEDVRINYLTFDKMMHDLNELYSDNPQTINKILWYLSFIMSVFRLQEENRIKLDVEQCKKNLEWFTKLKDEKVDRLKVLMPLVGKKSIKNKPKKMVNKDGSDSALAIKWYQFLSDLGLPDSTEGPVEYISSYVEPNPGSSAQIKDWLFSLGWKPETFKIVDEEARDDQGKKYKTGEKRRVPQIKKNNKLCPSVERLAESIPELEELVDYGVIVHRIGLLKGFLTNVDDEGYLVNGIAGLTSCVTADTLIQTNYGVIPIIEVTKEHKVLTHKGRYRRVTDFINNGVAEIYSIRTLSGKHIKCTNRHRFYIGGEQWKRADELKEGDRVFGYGQPEEWKTISDCSDNSAISSWGRLRGARGKISSYRRRVKKEIRLGCSYKNYKGQVVDRQLSRVLLETFQGPSNLHVLHKDGVPSNNNLENLYYGTDKDNHRDAIQHGTIALGGANRKDSKLSFKDVEEIKKLRTQGYELKQIAEWYDISSSYVSMIINDKRRNKTVVNKYREDFISDFISSIEILPQEPTYDISVEEDHSYVANGLVTHNTLRIRHKILVNLPGVTGTNCVRDGIYIRGVLIADEGEKLIGSDINGLEDQCKLHYIHPYDPVYVSEQQGEDWDSHLDISELAGLLTKEEVVKFKLLKKKDKLTEEEHVWIKKISNIRKLGKIVNFSSTYGVGSKTLARSMGRPEKEAKKLLKVYWQRNWSIKEFAEDLTVKKALGKTWVLNPVNNYWYELRSDRDRFSAINQGTGSFVFFIWVYFLITKYNIKSIVLNMHDEQLLRCADDPKVIKDVCEKIDLAMEDVNNTLKMNIKFSVESEIGRSYADCH